MRGWSLLRMLQALCAALALVVLPGLQVAHARSVSERRAPSTRASAGGGPSTSASASELGALLQLDRRWRLPGKEGAGRRAAARSAASTAPGEAGGVAAVASGAGVASVERRFVYDGVDHPLWMWDRVADAGVYFELDCIGNVRRLRGGARYGAGAALPSDLGGYKYSAFGRSVVADAGTPAPVVDGVSFAQPLRWQGRWLDTATGIYDVRNRVWSPELGAFLSPDEFAYVTTEGTLWSWPNQNPIAIRDPMGRGELQNYLDAASDIPLIGFLFAGPSAFGHGVQNRVEGTLKLANDATVEEGLAQRAKGNCQISIGAMATSATADVLVGAVQAAAPMAKLAPKVHLNAKASPAINHVYRIYDKATGANLKYGISGIPLIGEKSLRAEFQVARLGRGAVDYQVVAMARGRGNALWLERWLVTSERLADPNSLRMNILPTPWTFLP